MAEVKNSFIKSKMNKDLDARLIPNGEYRDAVNIQVSKSEGDDVGALENVLGNIEVLNLGNHVPETVDQDELTCIGYYVDDSNNDVYMFFTTYNDKDAFGAIPNFAPDDDTEYHGVFVYNTKNNSLKKLVEGRFLNFSKNKPIYGVNLLENILFWTDDRNQPRKINVKKPSAVTHYNTEDKISVAKYYPYQSPFLIKDSSIGEEENDFECSMYDVDSDVLPNGDVNPYYNEEFPGDPLYLEDKFVRFSYRFKFADGEYSLIAPFTQQCFIPKQDGYFIANDEKDTISSTNVSFMRNKINQIDLQIPLPYPANQLNSNLDVDEIDIVYKESDGLALKVVETIQVDQDFSNKFGDNEFCEYIYLSQKPYKTLPGNEVARVYDKVPVKALAQEVVSNRVIYGNFQDKHTSPSFIDYQVAASEKYPKVVANVDFPAKSTVEYPNHTVKENRNYQIGVVLSDRYGRQSSVILSNNKESINNGFGADTLYLPYTTEEAPDFSGNSIKVLFNEQITSIKNSILGTPGLYDEDTNPLGWYSYKIVIKQLEQDYYNVYTSGAVKGQPENNTTQLNSSFNNTTQLNSSFIVLIGDNINKVPRDLSEVGAQDKTFRSDTKLFGRVVNTQQEYSSIGNIQYDPGQKDFTVNAIEDLFDLFDTTEAISNHPITNSSNPYYTFLKGESNPFIGEFITSQASADQFGVINNNTGPGNTYLKTENLAVLETNPTVSNIDIYYETSTSGLISELNPAVNTESTNAVGISSWTYTHNESMSLNTQITNYFSFVDSNGAVLTVLDGTETLSVTDGSGVNRSSDFSIIENPLDSNEFAIFTNAYFYFDERANIIESYNFNLQCVTGTLAQQDSSSENINFHGELSNSAPSIDNDNTNTIVKNIGVSDILDNITGLNGSNISGGRQREGLSWFLSDHVYNLQTNALAPVFRLISEEGNLRVVNDNPTAEGTYTFTLNVEDTNGIGNNKLAANKVFTVMFDRIRVDDIFTSFPNSYTLLNGEGRAIWFVNSTQNLLNNNPFSQDPNFAYGLTAPGGLPGGADGPLLCPSTPGFNDRRFKNTTKYTDSDDNGALTKGYFYVFVTLNNTYQSDSPLSTTATHLAVDYRLNDSQPWVNALDMLDLPSGLQSSGNWLLDAASTSNPSQGMYSETGEFPPLDAPNTSSSIFPITVSSADNGGGPTKGARILAFSKAGEYRVILGNIVTNYPTTIFKVGDNGEVITNCSADQTLDGSATATIKFGDLYYTTDTNITRNSRDDFPDAPNRRPAGVYEYWVWDTLNCDEYPVPLVLYAREPFTKYVTQLFTDTSLTSTPVLTGTKRYKISRIVYNEGSANPILYNPENVKNAAYKLIFNNNGTREKSDLDLAGTGICLYPNNQE